MKLTRHISTASRGPVSLKKLVPNVRIVTDPKKLAFLKKEAAKSKRIEDSGLAD